MPYVNIKITKEGATAAQKAELIKGATELLVKVLGKNPPPRPQYEIWSAGPESARIGVVTSGTQSPSLGTGIGMGYVPPSHRAPETPIAIQVRGRAVEAQVARRPIFRKP